MRCVNLQNKATKIANDEFVALKCMQIFQFAQQAMTILSSLCLRLQNL